MASAQQYSPEQVLSMGRNAEAAGNLDYALKVYAHLVEHFGDIPEAEDARHGQQRIIAWQRAESARRNGGPGQAPPQPGGRGSGDRMANGPPPLRRDIGRETAAGSVAQEPPRMRPPPLSNRLEGLRSALPPEPIAEAAQPRPAAPPGGGAAYAAPLSHRGSAHQHGPQHGPAYGPQHGPGDHGRSTGSGAAMHAPVTSTGLVPAEPGLPRMIARASAEDEEAYDYVPYRRYRVGTFLASFTAVIGWLAVLGGLVILAAMLAGMGAGAVPALGRPGLVGLNVGTEAGAAALLAGLLLVFVSQIAHAVFDQANATVALLEIEQSRGDY